MRIRLEQLDAALGRGLAPAYLVYGDEHLLAQEACEAIRVRARAEGYTGHQSYAIETGFDWSGFSAGNQNLSLFAERRVMELRLPRGKPGKEGGEVIGSLCENLPEDTLLIVWSGKLEKGAQSSRWFKALEQYGVVIPVYPVEAAALPEWVARRMRSRKLKAENGVAELLAYRFEGNLLAVAQEIDKLGLLFPDGRVTLDDMQNNLGENARFDVFGLADSCLRGDRVTVMRALASLRAEGESPVLVLWALAREIRLLADVALVLRRGESEQAAFNAHHVWPKRQGLVRGALKRLPAGRWLSLVQAAARADRIAKGREPGEIWQALEAIGMNVCGNP